MKGLDSGAPDALRIQARLREIDRSLSSTRFRLGVVQWLYLPLMGAALVAMVVALVLGVGEAGGELWGALLIAGGVGGLVTYLRRMRDDVGDLEDERDSWLREISPPEDAVTRRVPPGA